MSEMGVCVECQTKSKDDTLKPISVCPICERAFCSFHSRTTLVYIPDFKHIDKIIKEAKEIIEKNHADDTGHPCLPYTLDFWKEYDLEKERKKQREKNNMDGFGYFTNEEIEIKLGRKWHELRKRLYESEPEENVIIPVSSEEKTKPKESFWE
jgi:hypothetical protein